MGTSLGDGVVNKTRSKKFTREKLQRMNSNERSMVAKTLSCRETMCEANWVYSKDSVADVIEDLTTNDWDHVFVVNRDGVPTGRIHAVDVLKLIAKKNVERSVAWMHSVPAQQLVNIPPLTVRTDTPLLKAGALMLTHDLGQIGVVNNQGILVGVVGHKTMAKHIPKFIL